MKKNILLYALLGLMAVVTSCSKTDETAKPTIPAADLAVWNKVQAFKARMANPLKDGDPLTVDSAVWYIETTLNCTYGDASYEFTDMHTDSAFTTLAVDNGQVDMGAVTVAYNQLLDSIRQHYYGLTATDKQFVFANVELIPTGLKTSEVTLKVTSGVGEESDGTTALFFGPNDYWTWGGSDWAGSGGYCDGPNVGLCTNSDAAKEITKKARLRLSQPGGNYYYSNYEWITATGIAYPGATTPNYCESYIFMNSDNYPNFHTCLTPYEMNFYLSGALAVAEDPELGVRPAGKHIVNITLTSDAFYPASSTTNFHIETIVYATVNYRPEDSSDL